MSPRGVDSPVVDGGLVTLTQLRDDGVACVAVVDGSRRAPQVEVIIGNVDATGTGSGVWTKFTSLFVARMISDIGLVQDWRGFVSDSTKLRRRVFLEARKSRDHIA